MTSFSRSSQIINIINMLYFKNKLSSKVRRNPWKSEKSCWNSMILEVLPIYKYFSNDFIKFVDYFHREIRDTTPTIFNEIRCFKIHYEEELNFQYDNINSRAYLATSNRHIQSHISYTKCKHVWPFIRKTFNPCLQGLALKWKKFKFIIW